MTSSKKRKCIKCPECGEDLKIHDFLYTQGGVKVCIPRFRKGNILFDEVEFQSPEHGEFGCDLCGFIFEENYDEMCMLLKKYYA